MRLRTDEVVQAHGSARSAYLFIVHTLIAIDQVLANGALEQPGILQHHAKQAVHILAAHVARGHPVDANLAAVDLEETHEQVDHGGLASARGTHDGDLLTGQGMGREILDDGLVRSVIGEAHVIELNLAAYRAVAQRGLGGFVCHLLRIEELEHARARGPGRLQRLHALGYLGKRLREVAHVKHEGDDHAKAYLTVKREGAARHAHRHVSKVADERHDGHHEAGQALGAETRRHELGVHAVELGAHQVLGVIGRDDRVTGIGLLDMAGQCAQGVLLAHEVLLAAAHDGHHQRKAQQAGAYGGKRHPPVCADHHEQAAKEQHHGGKQGADALVKRLGQRIDIIGDAGEDISGGHAVEVGHGQTVDLGRDLCTQPARDALRHRGHNEALQHREHVACYVEPNEHRRRAQHKLHVDTGFNQALDGFGQVIQGGHGRLGIVHIKVRKDIEQLLLVLGGNGDTIDLDIGHQRGARLLGHLEQRLHALGGIARGRGVGGVRDARHILHGAHRDGVAGSARSGRVHTRGDCGSSLLFRQLLGVLLHVVRNGGHNELELIRIGRDAVLDGIGDVGEHVGPQQRQDGAHRSAHERDRDRGNVAAAKREQLAPGLAVYLLASGAASTHGSSSTHRAVAPHGTARRHSMIGCHLRQLLFA